MKMSEEKKQEADLDDAFKSKLKFNDEGGDKYIINSISETQESKCKCRESRQKSQNIGRVQQKIILRKPKLKFVKFKPKRHKYDSCKMKNSSGTRSSEISTPELNSLTKKFSETLSDSLASTSCSQQARQGYVPEVSMTELAAYFDNIVYIPKKMSSMAEMMYT